MVTKAGKKLAKKKASNKKPSLSFEQEKNQEITINLSNIEIIKVKMMEEQNKKLTMILNQLKEMNYYLYNLHKGEK